MLVNEFSPEPKFVTFVNERKVVGGCVRPSNRSHEHCCFPTQAERVVIDLRKFRLRFSKYALNETKGILIKWLVERWSNAMLLLLICYSIGLMDVASFLKDYMKKNLMKKVGISIRITFWFVYKLCHVVFFCHCDFKLFHVCQILDFHPRKSLPPLINVITTNETCGFSQWTLRILKNLLKTNALLWR